MASAGLKFTPNLQTLFKIYPQYTGKRISRRFCFMQRASIETAASWPVCSANGFLALYDIRSASPVKLASSALAHEAVVQPLAGASQTMFWAMPYKQGNTLLWFESPSNIVLLHAGLGCAVIGTRALNVALAPLQFRDAPTRVYFSQSSNMLPVFDDVVKATLWALATLVERTEIAREFTISIGAFSISFNVAQGAVVSGLATEAQQTLAARFAATDMPPARYSIAPPEATIPEQKLGPIEILAIANAENPPGADPSGWQFTNAGWPVQSPKSAEFAQLAALTSLVQVAQKMAAGAENWSVSLFGMGRAPVQKVICQQGVVSVIST